MAPFKALALRGDRKAPESWTPSGVIEEMKEMKMEMKEMKMEMKDIAESDRSLGFP